MMQQEDTLPWYRQFWPWFLISIPGATVIAGLYTIMLAMDSTDSLVTADAGGMDVVTERHIAAERHAESLGLDAKLGINAVTGAITAELASTAGGEWPQTTLTKAIPAADGTPRWAGHVAMVPSGRWYLILKAADDWRLFGVWSGAASVHLRPASAADYDGGR
jgi:hypothetical protein